MPTAVFVLGGSASGKSSTIRTEYIGTLDLPDLGARIEPREGYVLDRWIDADRVKLEIPLYTHERGDAESVARFGGRDLGGPSGPRTISDYHRYPEDVRAIFEAFLRDRTGWETVEAFASEWFGDEWDDETLGGGLTHEVSKFLAQGLLEDALTEVPPQRNVIWDACGRSETYLYWIDTAIDNGYDVEVVYVTCPLKVALARAETRRRKLSPDVIEGTHRRAAETARLLELEIADMRAEGAPVSYRSINTSTAAEESSAE